MSDYCNLEERIAHLEKTVNSVDDSIDIIKHNLLNDGIEFDDFVKMNKEYCNLNAFLDLKRAELSKCYQIFYQNAKKEPSFHDMKVNNENFE